MLLSFVLRIKLLILYCVKNQSPSLFVCIPCHANLTSLPSTSICTIKKELFNNKVNPPAIYLLVYELPSLPNLVFYYNMFFRLFN